MASDPTTFQLQPVRIALVQLGQTSKDKRFNLDHARDAVTQAVREHPDGRSQLVVLPECFNSPYGVNFFDTYAESLSGLYEKVRGAAEGGRWKIMNKGGAHPISLDEATLQKSETLRLLSGLARENSIVLVGGSIPERDDQSGKLFNTSVVFDKEGESC